MSSTPQTDDNKNNTVSDTFNVSKTSKSLSLEGTIKEYLFLNLFKLKHITYRYILQ